MVVCLVICNFATEICQPNKGNMKKLWVLALMAVLMVGCSTDEDSVGTPKKSIVILYENDVHCGINGYPKYVGLRDAIVMADTSYVGMVSSGDFLQGALAGAYSQGQHIVDIMKEVGYDAITLGNHEFDYLTPRMLKLMPQIGAPVVCANFFEYGATTPVYPSYVIKQYGDKKIAFVGALTPETMRDEAYAFFDNDQKQLYDLRTNEVYSLVQTATDKARSEGADYVVVLSHLGEAKSDTGVDSHGLVAATNGIDAVLDGHTHSVIPCEWVANKDGKQIPVTQTGTQFANVGKLWISQDGTLHTQLVPAEEIPYTNDRISAIVDHIKTELDEATSLPVATTAFDLPAMDDTGDWLVRKMETSLGDLVADAFRERGGTNIGLVNGGALRNNLKAGVINYGHVISVLPNDNKMCVIEVTGAEIQNMLNVCTAKCPALDGSFPQVSGLKFTIHTVSHTVTDVVVLNQTTGEYEPIDAQRKYTLCVTDYYKTGGFYDTLKNCPLKKTFDDYARSMFVLHLKMMPGGEVSENYRTPQGRITIIDD